MLRSSNAQFHQLSAVLKAKLQILMEFDHFFIYSFALHPQGTQPKPGPTPDNLLSKMISLLPPVVFDDVLPFEKFGGLVKDADPKYKKVSNHKKTIWRIVH